MKYIKPQSLTFWSGLVPIALGAFLALEPVHGLEVWVDVVRDMTGGVHAYVLINSGLALIGLRAAV